MPRSKLRPKPAAAVQVDFTPLLPATVRSDDTIKSHLASAIRRCENAKKALQVLQDATREVETRDRLDNFEIQTLMSKRNNLVSVLTAISQEFDAAAKAMIAKAAG